MLADKLPNAALQICLFHTLRTFKREITTEKLKIHSDQRLALLEILSKLYYASNIDTYNYLYQQFVDKEITTATEYFNDNWHRIKEQWVDGLKTSNVEPHDGYK